MPTNELPGNNLGNNLDDVITQEEFVQPLNRLRHYNFRAA